MSGKNGQFYEFGEFRLDAENPSLWLDGELVSLPPKALELLALLVRRGGEIVSREELLETVWKETFVEEANINYTVSLLRKALDGSDKNAFIQTVPKRGYRFVAEVREISQNGKSEIAPPATSLSVNPPKNPVRWHFIGIVLLGVVLLTSFAAWWKVTDRDIFSGIPVSERNIRTVAVLPLKTLNEEEKSKALALGLTDLLISRLGSLNRFSVRPLSSVSGYTESDRDPLKFGEELKVDSVLEGTLQAVDDRLRVNLRLWDVRDGAQIWQDSFDSSEADFFDLQDAISNNVTESLVRQLKERDRELLTRRDTKNREAFDAYWRGRFYLEKRAPERAIPEFERAFALDPGYAQAYSGLADAYSMMANINTGADAELYRKSAEFADRALQLQPDLSEAHLSLARVKYLLDWDWQATETLMKRSLESNPNNAEARLLYAFFLSGLGRNAEALAELERVKEINPRAPYTSTRYFAILEKTGKLDEALEVAETFLQIGGEKQIGERSRASIFLLKGDYPRVIELGAELFPDLQKANFAWASMLATAFYKTGEAEKSAQMLKRLEQLAEKDTKALFFLAMNYSELGRTDESIAALRRCLKVREERLKFMKNEPRLANVESDSRFQDILREIKLAD